MNVEDIKLHEDVQFSDIQNDILFLLLSKSELAKAITGVVKKGKRPTRKEFAKDEDCTIESLDLPFGSVQFGTSNVNIYVPDIIDNLTIPNNPYYVADTKRLKELMILAFNTLKYYYSVNGWQFEPVTTGVFDEPALHCHRIWFKIRFMFHN